MMEGIGEARREERTKSIKIFTIEITIPKMSIIYDISYFLPLFP
jgi:hypothetical protein